MARAVDIEYQGTRVQKIPSAGQEIQGGFMTAENTLERGYLSVEPLEI